MADQQAFFNLLDIMESEKDIEPKRFFDLMRSTFDIANLLYIDLEVSSSDLSVHRLHHTFSANVIRAFGDLFLRPPDAVFRLLLNAIRPLDWVSIRAILPQGESLFSLENDLGLHADGVIVPLATSAYRKAFLAIEASVAHEHWSAYRRCHLRDFQYLGNLFHAAMLERADPAPMPSAQRANTLTPRESEVLGWAAAGKSYWEIAIILGISERTVRFFMTNARRKLNVVSNSQAVAQAVRQDLIPAF